MVTSSQQRSVDRAGWPADGKPFRSAVRPVSTPGYSRAEVMRCVNLYQRGLTQVKSWGKTLRAGEHDTAETLRPIVDGLLGLCLHDTDMVVAIATTSKRGSYPYRHSLQTCMLALAVGIEMDLDAAQLWALGLGCLIHDIGMLVIAEGVVTTDQILDQMQFLEVTRHPMAIYDLVQKRDDVPLGAKMVAYQMHERCDGSGYPRQRPGAQVHQLAKIAMMADVYIALISPRKHRAALTPNAALEEIFEQTKKKILDPDALKAFLRAISLHPIGSTVQLNDGRIGRVLRSNREDYSRPDVELWTPNNPADKEFVRLIEEPELVVEGTGAPAAAEPVGA